jgi:glycosyltransferase involved in cell wall biosynthesis
MPSLSIIIAVYNDWIALDSCLRSIAQQAQEASIEVIVVDDGSDEAAPDMIRKWAGSLPLTVVRQLHSGISAARNHGIRVSSGALLLFVDADCRLQENCLEALESIINASPRHNYFQLRLVGNCSGFMGKTEHLRLTSIQNHMLQPNGCVRYLNTAGFVVRRSIAPIEKGLFEPVALRGEDTLLLATLIERGELPFFVADAIIQHEVSPSLFGCLRKDIRSAFLEGGTYGLISSRGVRIRMSNRERLRMARSMWTISRQPSIGRMAWLALTVRQLLSRISTVTYRLLCGWSDSRTTSPASLNENL